MVKKVLLDPTQSLTLTHSKLLANLNVEKSQSVPQGSFSILQL